MSGLFFVLHGLTLALVWFLVVNAAATLLVIVVAGHVTRQERVTECNSPSARGSTRSPRALILSLSKDAYWAISAVKRFGARDSGLCGRPAFWLWLRLLPAAASIGFVAAVFLPSYWKYEPREFAEGFDVTLAALAAAGFMIVATAAARGVAAVRRASRRARTWLLLARPLTLDGSPMPAFEIDADVPIMAVVGVVRPRLLIARGVLQALSGEELSASVAHEIGHQRAWDNLKRLAMRTAPDLMTTTAAARAVERRWASASEQAADRQACHSGRARCALASALVKVARLAPPATPIADPVCTLVEGGEIASRVQRLLEDAPAATPPRAAWHWPALALGSTAVALAYAPLLRGVHALTELIVHSL